MSEHVLEVCYSLKEAIQSIKERLSETDSKCLEMWNWYKENMPEKIEGNSMEDKNWNDKIYLVYRSDFFIDECWLFEDDYDIQCWLEEKWSDWDLWDYDDLNGFFEENLVIWEFHRNICNDMWNHYRKYSKPFMEGWSRKREQASFEAVPSFSIG
ncbi:hypothetical protein [Ornithinibacillus xuwenensis]|uniref:Uncharacterized protein n=1 Tax=Ornithinibacillus xuwenensis TaxID=3144668 RepID=A0ABU9XDB2_9BACI